jgi:hypothetical protein
MKKLSLLALAVVTSLAIYAQDNTQLKTPMARTTRFGLDAGINLANLHVDKEGYANQNLAPTTNSKTAFHGGVFVDIPLGGVVSLKPSITYSKQGAKVKETTQSGTGTTQTSFEEDLDYIYVAPAALVLTSPSGLMFETGPQVGFLISGSRENQTTNVSTDIKNNRRSTDLLWSAGLGWMSRVGLGLHARYNHGFSNIIKSSGTTSAGKMENRLVQVGLMYHFGAHK